MKIVYPGTFDPLTLGHSDLIHRASRMFSQVIIAVAASPRKQPLFSLTERQAIIEEVLLSQPELASKVKVISFSGLLVDLMQQLDANYVLRGVRSGQDFDYEVQLAQLNATLLPEMDSIFLPPNKNLGFIAATLVREVASLGGDVSQLVHPYVAGQLKQKFST